jgi:hypothetical protein
MAHTIVTANRSTTDSRILRLETEIYRLESVHEVLQRVFEQADEQRDRLLELVPAAGRESLQERLDADRITTAALQEHVVTTLQGSIDALDQVDRELWRSRGSQR